MYRCMCKFLWDRGNLPKKHITKTCQQQLISGVPGFTC
jgi:hypothetical protein